MSRSAGPPLRIHYLQHVCFEEPAGIATWARRRAHKLVGCRVYRGQPLPSPAGFDCLVVMGGPMSVHDEKAYPWLVEEKKLIERATKGGKRVLGVCLGAQLLADVLGARVYRSRQKEIGWFPVHLTRQATSSSLLADFPEMFHAFHWHGDTFDIPAGALRLAKSEACENQAFEFDGRVLGLQFHLEVTPASVRALTENCRADIGRGKYQQSPRQMLASRKEFDIIRPLLYGMLDRLTARGAEQPGPETLTF